MGRRAAEPRPEMACELPDCGVVFTPSRAGAKYHSATCRKRAERARKAAERQGAEEAKSNTDAEHGLVRAVRLQLEKAGVLDTVNGQLALELARRAVTPESSLVSMSKELDARMAAALGPGTKPAEEPEPAEQDDVAKAREARDRKRAAAGQA